MNEPHLAKRLGETVSRHRLIEPGERVVLGVSGGPDSMAMLHALVAADRDLRSGWTLHVAHLNHKIRGADADADAEFVADQASALRLTCTIESEDVPVMSAQAKRSVEETGRARRYLFLERVCLRVGATAAATAHHADDNVETVLHHIIRGTGLRGLAGIALARPVTRGSEIRLVRPMLAFRRAELRAYLDEAGIPYRHDRSNESDAHTRNRLRNHVLPLLADQFNPQVADALLRLAEQARGLAEYLDTTARQLFEALVVSRDERQIVLDVELLAKKTPAIQAELIRLAIGALRGSSAWHSEVSDREIGFEHLRSVSRLAAHPGSGKQIDLPGGMTIYRRYRHLIFSLTDDETEGPFEGEEAVTCPGRTILAGWGLVVTTEIVPFGRAAPVESDASRLEERLDFDQVRLPLTARSRRPGDRFRPLGATGSKKLSDFFIDAKVPPERRDRAAILCDELGPIWIIGHRIDERVRLRRDTSRVLEIVARPQ